MSEENDDSGQEEVPDYLSMSDEEFANLPEDYFEEGESETDEGQDTEGDPAEDEDTDTDDDEDTDDENEDGDDSDESDGGDDDDSAGDSDGDDDSDPDTDGDDSESEEESESDTDEVDYKAAYEELFAPFKANGRDIKVDTVADIRQLMQMGANYNKKMQGMKPSMKILKTLENNEISQEKLNYLIDLDKKDPAAIARLVKEAGIDPLDFDLEQGEKYTAGNHSADDAEVEVDSVLSDIKDSPHYNQTLELVATKWDTVSKQAVREAPQLLKVINDHMASGVYDVISTEMEHQRMLGQNTGMSDLDAYRAVGDAIQARGGFDHLFKSQEQGQQNSPPADKPAPNKRADDSKRRDKRRAASPTKPAPAAGKTTDYNPLALSDAEFEKQFNSEFM